MANNLQKKPFLDYQAQINYLKQKQLVIDDEVSAIIALKKASYYGLINGYKEIFKDPATNNFYPATTFDDIYNLFRTFLYGFLQLTLQLVKQPVCIDT